MFLVRQVSSKETLLGVIYFMVWINCGGNLLRVHVRCRDFEESFVFYLAHFCGLFY